MTTTWANSGWALELLLGDPQAPLDLLGVVGAAPDRAASRSASSEGGAMNTCTASGIAARTWRAPWTSISSTTGHARADATLELGAQRPVAAPGVVGVLDELARRDQLVELLAAEEVVVDAVALARARRAGGGRHRQLELRHALAQAADQRALADPRGPRYDEHAPTATPYWVPLRRNRRARLSGAAARSARCAGARRARRSSCSARSGSGRGSC